MLRLSSTGAIALVAALGMSISAARAEDGSKYPDWKGQWVRTGGVQWDPTKPLGRSEQPPLTPEYQAIFEAGLASQKAGGQGNDPTYTCIPPGMPRAMTVIYPMEIIIKPETTYIMIEYANQLRRIYTDGRDWAKNLEPSFAGYSIGTWEDSDGDGRYDVLVVETRGMKGPRTFDTSGIPLHRDNQTVVKERIALDRADSNILHDEVTTIDNALTRPWTVTRSYRRETNPIWFEYVCAEGNHHVVIGRENYFVSEDGHLMPTRKGQPAPDLKFFGSAAVAGGK
jgi:hypothetical protein